MPVWPPQFVSTFRVGGGFAVLAGCKAVHQADALGGAMQHEADLSGSIGFHMRQELGRFEEDRLSLLGTGQGKPGRRIVGLVRLLIVMESPMCNERIKTVSAM
jgi:hypothetical protein